MRGRNTTVITARVSDDLARRLRQRVKRLGVSLSEYVEGTLDLVDHSPAGLEVRQMWDDLVSQERPRRKPDTGQGIARGRNTTVIKARIPDKVLEVIKQRAEAKGIGYTVLARHYLQEKCGLRLT